MTSAVVGLTPICCGSRLCPQADSDSEESEGHDCCVGITYSSIFKETGLYIQEVQLSMRARGEEAIEDDYVMETELEADEELVIQNELTMVEQQILSLSRRISFGGRTKHGCFGWQLAPALLVLTGDSAILDHYQEVLRKLKSNTES